jgi:hypothetical protein
MNINQLELALSEKVSSASSDYDLLVYTKSLQLLKNGAVFVVANAGELPSAASNEGKLYFIENLEGLVWSDGVEWKVLFDKTVLFENQIWSWGAGGLGRLGNEGSSSCSPVREISSSTDWCQVSSSYTNSFAIKSSGELWGWGRNYTGNLGIGTAGASPTFNSPVQEITSSTDWCQVSGGNRHTSAVKTGGELWIWGSNSYGEIGDGTTVNKCSPVREISSSTDWCQVSAGGYNSSAIKTTGEIWSWGDGSCGSLGDGTTVNKCSPVREISSSTNWCQVSAGTAIKTTGEIWSWGRNNNGQLGDGSTTNRCSPVQEISSSTNWCQVSSGGCHSSAVKTTGEIWSWGQGSCGRLGNGSTTNRCSPVQEISSSTNWCQVGAGICHSSAIKTTGEIWSWGLGSLGRLGDGTTVNKCSPVQEISSSTNWCQVALSYGNCHTAAIKLVTTIF